MSKIEVNSNVILTGVRIYAEDGALFADFTGEAESNIGVAKFTFPKFQLDFNAPEQTGAVAFAFKDGAGRVGYNFNFGNILYMNKEEEFPTTKVADEELDTEETINE